MLGTDLCECTGIHPVIVVLHKRGFAESDHGPHRGQPDAPRQPHIQSTMAAAHPITLHPMVLCGILPLHMEAPFLAIMANRYRRRPAGFVGSWPPALSQPYPPRVRTPSFRDAEQHGPTSVRVYVALTSLYCNRHEWLKRLQFRVLRGW